MDPAKKLWIGNIPEDANWKDLQALVDQAPLRPLFSLRSVVEAGKSRWVEIFRGKGKGTGAVVPFASVRAPVVQLLRFNTAEEAEAAKANLNGADLCGSSIVVDSWEKGPMLRSSPQELRA